MIPVYSLLSWLLPSWKAPENSEGLVEMTRTRKVGLANRSFQTISYGVISADRVRKRLPGPQVSVR